MIQYLKDPTQATQGLFIKKYAKKFIQKLFVEKFSKSDRKIYRQTNLLNWTRLFFVQEFLLRSMSI